MQLSREAIQRMFDSTGGSAGAGGGGSISPSILASYASQEFVQKNYVSIEFFNRLFKIHGTSDDILPNDTETVISHIEANYGFWTQSFLSAFGYNSSGGGGGGGGDGSVTSVGLRMPTGFTVSGTPVTTAGTLAVTFASGYSLPTTARQANWDTAYGWGDHSLVGYATQQWVTAQGFSTLTMTNVWTALASSEDSNRKINVVHLPDLSSTYLTVEDAASTYAQKATTLAGYGITNAYTKTYIDNLVSTMQHNFAMKATTLSGYGITDAYTKAECDNKYVTIATQQNVTGEKTFNTYTYFKESIILDKQAQQYIQFNAGTNKVGFYGQGSDGSLYVYSENPINWYTDINGHVGLAVWGNGNVGVGALNPQYNLDVTGTARATTAVIIGGAKLSWDSANNALKVESVSGGTCNFYATGGVAALGTVTI